MAIKRRPLQGVLNILSFNRHFYVIGFSILAMIIISRLFFAWPPFLFYVVIVAFVYGLVMPLIVSAYVYDLSGYYALNWLDKCNIDRSKVRQVLNIMAGFDETSFIIKDKFPEAELTVFDFYDAKRHTEPAIIRARKVSNVYPNTRQLISNKIPVPDNSVDILFLLSAAHEIRSFSEKVEFLNECRRVCGPDAKVMMVEHLRDLPNFLAFTVGFTHFFSRATWKDAFAKAGFSSFEEVKFTQFMSIFICRP